MHTYALTLLGLLYTYLADCAGKSGRGAVRSLQRGFAHWSSGRLAKLEVNYRHPQFCHVHCQMTHSMKQGLYHVYILLGREGDVATIRAATCECAAGCVGSILAISFMLIYTYVFLFSVNQRLALMYLHCYMLLLLLHHLVVTTTLMPHQMKKQRYQSLPTCANGTHHASVRKATEACV